MHAPTPHACTPPPPMHARACAPQILEGILPKETQRGAPPPDKRLLEHHFVFACVWAFGGCLQADRLADHRKEFSRWWQTEHKGVAFPAEVGGGAGARREGGRSALGGVHARLATRGAHCCSTHTNSHPLPPPPLLLTPPPGHGV